MGIAPDTNKRVADFLVQGLANNKLHHAYCFVGPDHAGKRALADSFAKSLMCLAGSGCGLCTSCTQINHADVVRLDGEKEVLTIDAVREWIQALTLTAFGKGRRIGMLYHAHVLTPAVQNVLLKTLEEPPANTVILMTSHSLLIPTIMSRVQLMRMARHVDATDAPSELETLFRTMMADGVTNELMSALTAQESAQTRQRMIAFLEAGERVVRNQLVVAEHKTPKIFSSNYAMMQALDAMRVSIRALHVNADPRLVLENCYYRMVT